MKKLENLGSNKLWQLAVEITEQCYGLIDDFPDEEKYGMQSKLRSRAFDLS